MRRTLEIFADYHQIILQDAAAATATGWGELAWPEDALARMLAVAPTAVGIGTARADVVPVVIDVVASAPPPPDDCDLVTEASLDAPSGAVVCLGPTDYLPDAARIDLTPGRYGVRVHARGLDSAAAHGNDRYEVFLWPCADELPPRVVRDRRSVQPDRQP